MREDYINIKAHKIQTCLHQMFNVICLIKTYFKHKDIQKEIFVTN